MGIRLKHRLRPPKEWIVPSNPKYYDVQTAFAESDEIDWNIPFHFDNGEVHMSSIMKIKLLKRYDPNRFTFDVLGKEYGIFAVRGPRGIPQSLSEALK